MAPNAHLAWSRRLMRVPRLAGPPSGAHRPARSGPAQENSGVVMRECSQENSDASELVSFLRCLCVLWRRGYVQAFAVHHKTSAGRGAVSAANSASHSKKEACHRVPNRTPRLSRKVCILQFRLFERYALHTGGLGIGLENLSTADTRKVAGIGSSNIPPL